MRPSRATETVGAFVGTGVLYTISNIPHVKRTICDSLSTLMRTLGTYRLSYISYVMLRFIQYRKYVAKTNFIEAKHRRRLVNPGPLRPFA